MAGQMRVGDAGTTIRMRVTDDGSPLNAAAATVKTLKLQKPDGSVVARNAAFETSGADGVFVYVTEATDLDQAGPWKGQLLLEFSASQKWHTDVFPFEVGEAFEVTV